MKLNKEGKNALRNKIEELLKRVPEGQKIHLQKDLLEDLLFETLTLNQDYALDKKNEEIAYKLPIWTGDFLTKIDLSEVSFEKVLFAAYPEYLQDKFSYMVDKDFKISFKNTNANIKYDFSKAREHDLFYNCDFSNVNLSNVSLVEAYNCIFTNTNVNAVLPTKETEINLGFYNCDFSGCDFSNKVLDAKVMAESTWDNNMNNCNFNNTKIKVTVDYSDFFETSKEYLDSSKTHFSELIKKGYFDGCYINGKLIKSESDRKIAAESKMVEYEQYRDNLFDSVESSIEEQIGRMKK